MEETLLLTGATGHVGNALLPRLLDAPGRRVLCLVRARDAEHLAARRLRLLEKTGADPDRVGCLRGDVSQPGLGLSAVDRERVDAEVGSIVHSAASVRFDMPADDAAKQNTQSTAEVLAVAAALAERGQLRRLGHVSTCYIAGDRRGRVLETECDEGQGFRNAYEWSKCQSEKKVRAAIEGGLPAAIYRPSIIVGDSRSGATDSFNVMYWPLKLYARGWWRLFPGSPDTLADIVPVDFVADAITRLQDDPRAQGRCFHLAAGDDAARVEDLVERVRAILEAPPLRYVEQGRYRRWIRPLLAPLFWTKRGAMIKRGGEAFLPYFTGNPLFDTAGARELLGEGCAPPPVMDYLETVVRYAVSRDFGAA